MPSSKAAALVGLLCAILTKAHLEDYCVYPSSNKGDNITNFFHAASDKGCKYGSYLPGCTIPVLKASSGTFAYSSPCRGAIHFDAVYIVSLAVGLLPEFAYWVAAFSQGIDFVQFSAVDSCGRDLGPAFMTPPLRGLMRTSAPTVRGQSPRQWVMVCQGGSMRHLGIPYGLEKTNGLAPNMSSTAEGTLASFRGWARGDSDQLCTNGLTEEVNGIPFGGATCAEGRWLTPHASKMDQGPIPAHYVPYELGEQILHYECEGNPACDSKLGPLVLTNKTMASQLDGYLAGSQYAKLSSGQPVPTVIAKIGFLLHLLADRASHYWCTDSASSGLIPDSTQPKNFTVSLDKLACNFVTHAMEHFWEQAVDQPLAPQSWAALNLYYTELMAWKAEPSGAKYFNASAVMVTREELIGTPEAPGTLPKQVVKREVEQRVAGLQRLVTQYGWVPLPGFETACNGSKW